VSNHEVEVAPAQSASAMESLAETVGRVADEIGDARRRAAVAEERAKRSDELLRQFVGGKRDPVALTSRVSELEAENELLRRRLREGRHEIDRVLARIRFLEARQ